MISKPHPLIKCLYQNVSRKICDPSNICIKYGVPKLLHKNACPFYKVRLLSTGRPVYNSEGEGTPDKSISSAAVDAIKNAVSKAYTMNPLKYNESMNRIRNSYGEADEDRPLSLPLTLLLCQKIEEKSKDTEIITKIQYETFLEKKVANFVHPTGKSRKDLNGDSSKRNGKSKDKAVKKKVRVDLSVASMERNFITPARAISDFLLKPQDLESLKAIKRRSPYENDPPITVYWRKDVEAKAIEVWGSKENLQKELLQRDLERKFHQQYLFANKKRMKDYRKVRHSQNEIALNKTSGLFGSSGKVVLTAVAINGSNFVFKLAAWMYSGSHSMFSESIHSLADTINQLILAFGIHKSVQSADEMHPYGYSNMKYVSSLISGVGIFCVGTGLSLYHGITGLYNPSPAEPFFWAFCVLGGSLVSEGATLLVAINSIKKGAAEKGMTFTEYVLRGQDPSVNVVLLEDMAAVLGVIVAASCMGLTSITGSHVPDAVGSIIIGGLLGVVASFIIYTNVAALVGRSISQEFLEKINTELESDVMIRAIHDVKGIDMGNCLVRYKAELDFDGRELAKAYLDTQNIHALLEEVQQFKTIDELEQFILKHSENIIDRMGSEIDRIEVKLRTKFPEIRHCDLEIL